MAINDASSMVFMFRFCTCLSAFLSPIAGSSFYLDYDTLSGKAINEGTEDCVWPTSIAHGFVQVLSPDDGPIAITNKVKPGSKAIYHCAVGYFIVNGSVEITCVNGVWQGDLPICGFNLSKAHCPQPPTVSYALPYLDNGSLFNAREAKFTLGTRIIYSCSFGYIQQGSSFVTCMMGEWIGPSPKCVPEKKNCDSLPPVLVHGEYSLNGKDTFMNMMFPSGLHAFYYCNNGYQLKDVNFAVLTCADGIWKGNLTTCIPRTSCDPPADIKNGNWIIKSLYSDFRIGVSVLFECDEGFKAVGPTEIVCQAPGYWSDYGPQCLSLDLYCPEPEPAANGYFMCRPNHCNFFLVGTEIHHVCNMNFEPLPFTPLIQTCMSGGLWSGEKPHCVLANSATTNVNSLNVNSMNSVNVVVSTACGVLGLLIFIVLVVVIKKFQRRRRCLCLSSISSSHPDFSDHFNNDLDYDALISDADFVCSNVLTLPSYEECIENDSLFSYSPPNVSWASSTRPIVREVNTLPVSYAMDTVVSIQCDMAIPESSLTESLVTTAVGLPSCIVGSGNESLDLGLSETIDVYDAVSNTDTVNTCVSVASDTSLEISHVVADDYMD